MHEPDKHAWNDRPNPWGYSTSSEPETWEHADTREEAIELARGLVEEDDVDVPDAPAGTAYIHAGDWPDPADFVPTTETVLDHMNENAKDNGCPDGIDDAFELAPGAEEALDRMLEAWARTYVRASFWRAVGQPEAVPAVAPAPEASP